MTSERPGREAANHKNDMSTAEAVAQEICFADHDSFRAAFERFSRPVLGFLYNMLGDLASAEEAMQETFVRAYRNAASMRGDSAVSTWIFGIARNVVREELRARRRGKRLVGIDETDALSYPDGRAGPDVTLRDLEAYRAVHAAVGALPEDQRLVFVLKVLRQMRYNEISRVTGASVAKLKSDLHRARAALREQLGGYFGSGANT